MNSATNSLGSSALNLQNLPVNWFDGLVVILLVVGFFRGRKRGMSEEMIPLFQWLSGIVLGGLYYEKLGVFLQDLSKLPPLYAFLSGYLIILFFVMLVFLVVRRLVGEKPISADTFGRGEYYLGMVAGMLCFACYIIAFLAVINGPIYTEAELQETRRKQAENFSGVSFPTPGEIHGAILKESFTGQAARKYLENSLIKPTANVQSPAQRAETLGEKRTKEIEKASGR